MHCFEFLSFFKQASQPHLSYSHNLSSSSLNPNLTSQEEALPPGTHEK